MRGGSEDTFLWQRPFPNAVLVVMAESWRSTRVPVRAHGSKARRLLSATSLEDLSSPIRDLADLSCHSSARGRSNFGALSENMLKTSRTQSEELNAHSGNCGWPPPCPNSSFPNAVLVLFSQRSTTPVCLVHLRLMRPWSGSPSSSMMFTICRALRMFRRTSMMTGNATVGTLTVTWVILLVVV